MRKTNSTNFENEAKVAAECPIFRSTRLISGRWKTHILWLLSESPKRFSEVRAGIPLATERMIALRLRELCADQLVSIDRSDAAARYFLTEYGRELLPVMRELLRVGLAQPTMAD